MQSRARSTTGGIGARRMEKILPYRLQEG